MACASGHLGAFDPICAATRGRCCSPPAIESRFPPERVRVDSSTGGERLVAHHGNEVGGEVALRPANQPRSWWCASMIVRRRAVNQPSWNRGVRWVIVRQLAEGEWQSVVSVEMERVLPGAIFEVG